ncbi:alpha-N-acetylglucosaminidase-like isoform X2 [Mercenaria mercenaria]|uniref:alpha-N-acetylglucosaminidase-like isoform X2 n=1 Tax=Mercenaria mercenaria TaxID=6596 RepID=UPI00234F6E8E|nr:alpha-N-acetylglucosaminidase-like isoform X2 [Mercenaria mercenaria]
MDMVWLVFVVTMVTVVSASVFPNLDHISPSASLEDQRHAAQELIFRVLGSSSGSFKVDIITNNDQEYRDTFNLVSDGNNVTISATSGVAAAMGFYYFLKTKCGCQFTWAGEQLSLPSPLPVISKPGITVTTNDRFRYYQNVCTPSYSFVWWDWERWQRHIDWMAMNGINLPLAFTGQEAIFQRVYRKLGFTDEQLQHHFGGPAFLAWARMGNMQGWGGPLPQTWITDQLTLQKKILGRMRELGMTPVLPGFAGHVPMSITKIYPNVKVSRLSDWGHFNQTYCCTYLLDFQEPLFQQIGTAFIQEMQSEFGVDHVYNADSFNEMNPSSNDTSYIRSAGKSVYSAMTAADPQAVWLMQGWLFSHNTEYWKPPQVKALLTSVPKGRMIVLDLFAEVLPVYKSTHSFYGQPFIWCMLHNFGGTMELYGVIDNVNEGPFNARKFVNSTMIGTGLTPEGIFQNEVMYEIMNENAYAASPRNLTEWFSDFARNRYGKYNQDADQAWQLLKHTVYNCTDTHSNGWVNVLPTQKPRLALWQDISVYNNTDMMTDHSKNVIPTSRPNIKPHIPDIWYNPEQLYSAWNHMVKASNLLGNSSLFRYDLVDIARNSLQVISTKFYTEAIAAYKEKDKDMLKTASKDLLEILNDMEVLLGSDIHFVLGPWIRDARKHGHTVAEQNLMEYNARNQITLWGPNGEIRDYAAKQWSGLLSGYYTKRWQMFLGNLQQCLEKDKPFRQKSFDNAVLESVEKPFTFDRSPVPITPTGDSVKIASDLYKKYVPTMQSGFYRHLKDWSQQGWKNYSMLSLNWVKKKINGSLKERGTVHSMICCRTTCLC